MKSVGFACVSFFFACAILSAQSNPVPLVNNPLVPSSARPGGTGFTLTVNGSGFVPGSVVNWDHSALVTTFLNNSQLSAVVPATNIAARKTASVTVFNPLPGGGTSNVAFFQLTAPTKGFGVFQSTIASTPFIDVVAGDFNGDGDMDLAFGEFVTQYVDIFLGDGHGTFRPPMSVPVQYNAYRLIAGDLNGDGKLDLVAFPYQSTMISVLLGNGDGTFQPYQTVPIGFFDEDGALGDLNDDGKLDLVVTTATDSSPFEGLVAVLLGNGDGTFQNHVDYVVGRDPKGIVLGDFNQDGNLDVAAADDNPSSSGPSNVYILLGTGSGTLQGATAYTVGGGPSSLVTADFNHDGILDLAVANSGDDSGLAGSTVSILLGIGNGTFQPQMTYATGPSINIAMGDLNSDGNLDLIVAASAGINYLGQISVLLGNNDGSFQTQIPIVLSGQTIPASLATVDINNDGKLDVAMADFVGIGGLFLRQGTLEFSSTNVVFPTQIVGRQDQPTQTVALTNSGAATLNISNISVQGTNSTDFTETNDCQPSLGSRKTCTIRLSFLPTAAGSRTASVSISDDTHGSPQSMLLQGTGTLSIVQFSPPIVDFHDVKVGKTKGPDSVYLTNAGFQTLKISRISVEGASLGEFSQHNNCGSSVPPGMRCMIGVLFTPSQLGPRNANLVIRDDGGESPQRVPLQGIGIDGGKEKSGVESQMH